MRTMQNVLPFSTQWKMKSHLIMKVDPPFFTSAKIQRRCKNRIRNFLSFFQIPTLWVLSCCWQKWKSGLDESSRDTQRHQSSAGPLPMPHHSSKPWKAADLPPCCSLAPTQRATYLAAVYCLCSIVSSVTVGPSLLCLLPVQSHAAPMVHKCWAAPLLLLLILPPAAG